MSDKVIFGLLGFGLGAVAGGTFVGLHCRRLYRSKLEEANNEVDRLIEEGHKTAQRGLYGAQEGCEEDDYDIDEPVEFDDPFEGYKDMVEISFDGERYSFVSEFEAYCWLDDDENVPEDELIKKRRVSYRVGNMLPIGYSSLNELLKVIQESINHDSVDGAQLRAEEFYRDQAGKGKTLKSYSELSREYRSPEFDEHFATRDHPHDDDEEGEDGSIYLIDADQFKKDISYRDDETITYYQQDGVLVNSADRVITNPVKVIGDEAAREMERTDKDELYVSNDIEDKVYEIVIEHMYAYRDMVGGPGA